MSCSTRAARWIARARNAGLVSLVYMGDMAVRALLVGLGRGERGSVDQIIDVGLAALDARSATWREMMRGGRVLRAAAALGGLENQRLARGRAPGGR